MILFKTMCGKAAKGFGGDRKAPETERSEGKSRLRMLVVRALTTHKVSKYPKSA